MVKDSPDDSGPPPILDLQRRTSGGLIAKSILFRPEEEEALRRRAFEEHRSETSLVREALRLYLGLAPGSEP